MPESTLGVKRFVSPEMVVSHFHIRQGDVVADYGAGGGFYIELLSKKVGDDGKVYACDIQKSLVEKIGELTRLKGITNVHPLWCDIETPRGLKIGDSAVDVGLLINTLFQLENAHAGLTEIARTIRSGGKLCIVDWSESFGGLGPQESQVMTQEKAQALVLTCGFVYDQTFDAGDHHYGISFRKI